MRRLRGQSEFAARDALASTQVRRCRPTRSAIGTVRFAASLVALLVASSVAVGANAATPRAVAAAAIVGQLRLERAVVLENVVVRGTLDFRGVGTVRASFKCQGCRFVGAVHAADVVFSRGVDMRESLFEHGADFSGAAFEGDATFDQSVFARRASFGGAAFRSTAGFRGTRFGGSVDFSGAAFSKEADLSDAEFDGDAEFADARFGGGATYFKARFRSRASFDRVSADGDLDFTFAEFEGPAVFGNATVGGTLSFEDAFFFGVALRRSERHELPIRLDQLRAARLVLAVDAVRDLDARSRRVALKQIEATASVRGDTATANDAEYELHVLAAEGYPRWLRFLDLVFYRGAAGYLLRPVRPLAVLLAAVAAAVVFRRYRRRARPAQIAAVSPMGRSALVGVPTRRPVVKRVVARRVSLATSAADLLGEFWDELATILPRRGAPREYLPLTRRLEILVYRVLFVCFLVALARANQGLRDMIDALTSKP